MPNKQPYDTQRAAIVRALIDGQTLDYSYWSAKRIFCHHKRLEGIMQEVWWETIRSEEMTAKMHDGMFPPRGNHQPFFPIVNVGSLKGNPVDGNRCGVYKLAPGWRKTLKKIAKEKGWIYG